MAGKSSIQKLIEDYETSTAAHQRAIESNKQFIEALKATQKAKARVKPRKGGKSVDDALPMPEHRA